MMVRPKTSRELGADATGSAAGAEGGKQREQATGGDAPSTGTGADDSAASEGPSFEQAAERLAQIVEQLESGELALERSLELFEEGTRLARQAQRRLDAAERRVEQLLGIGPDGQPITSDLEGQGT